MLSNLRKHSVIIKSGIDVYHCNTSTCPGHVFLRWRFEILGARFWRQCVKPIIPGPIFICWCYHAMAGTTQLNSSLLTISVIAVLLPAAFQFSTSSLSDTEQNHDILSVSHGVCMLLWTTRLAFDIISRLPWSSLWVSWILPPKYLHSDRVYI